MGEQTRRTTDPTGRLCSAPDIINSSQYYHPRPFEVICDFKPFDSSAHNEPIHAGTLQIWLPIKRATQPPYEGCRAARSPCEGCRVARPPCGGCHPPLAVRVTASMASRLCWTPASSPRRMLWGCWRSAHALEAGGLFVFDARSASTQAPQREARPRQPPHRLRLLLLLKDRPQTSRSTTSPPGSRLRCSTTTNPSGSQPRCLATGHSRSQSLCSRIPAVSLSFRMRVGLC